MFFCFCTLQTEGMLKKGVLRPFFNYDNKNSWGEIYEEGKNSKQPSKEEF